MHSITTARPIRNGIAATLIVLLCLTSTGLCGDLDGGLSQAVYDALGVLAGKGLIRRIQPAGSPARYEGRTGDNHHHLICRACGRMVDVDCAVGGAPCLTPADDAGYEIDEAEVVYWGRCPGCLAQPPGEHAIEEEQEPEPAA